MFMASDTIYGGNNNNSDYTEDLNFLFFKNLSL